MDGTRGQKVKSQASIRFDNVPQERVTNAGFMGPWADLTGWSRWTMRWAHWTHVGLTNVKLSNWPNLVHLATL